jgi:hypothetical protein
VDVELVLETTGGKEKYLTSAGNKFQSCSLEWVIPMRYLGLIIFTSARKIFSCHCKHLSFQVK